MELNELAEILKASEFDEAKIAEDINITELPQKNEEEQFAVEIRQEQLRHARLTNDDQEANMEFRRNLVKWVKNIVIGWLVFTAVAIGTSYACYSCSVFIPPSVLCTLLATTTVNILGLMAIVLRGLFEH